MAQLTTAKKLGFQATCKALAWAPDAAKLEAFDDALSLIDPDHAEQIRGLSKEQKLAIINKGASDPQGAVDDLQVDIFDAMVLKEHPDMAPALATVSRDRKLQLIDEQEPNRTRDIKLALFDAKVLSLAKTPEEKAALEANLKLVTQEQKLKIIDDCQKDPQHAQEIAEKGLKLAIFDAKFMQVAAPHGTDAEKKDAQEKLALLTEEQKLKIIDDVQKDPAHGDEIAARETKLAIFDAAILKDHPEMKNALSKISADDKLKLMDEPEPQRTEDIKIRMFDASMEDMYKQHPDLKEKIDKIPRQQKLQLIDAIGEGLKQDPQLLDHVNQAMKDHPQAFNNAINALIEDPSKKNGLVGLLAADQMQHKIVDMFGGPDSAFGKVVNWIFNFLIDGPLGGFITGIFGSLAGAMGGLQGAATQTQPGGQPALQGASADFEIAHTAVHGSVEDTNSGKVYHLRGELNNDEKAELSREPSIKYNYDRAANETTIQSTNRNWSLPVPAHA